jgi:hypothetical protein
MFLAVAAKESGREEEARGGVRRLLELYPKFTIKRHMDVAPFKKETPENSHVARQGRRALPADVPCRACALHRGGAGGRPNGA